MLLTFAGLLCLTKQPDKLYSKAHQANSEKSPAVRKLLTLLDDVFSQLAELEYLDSSADSEKFRRTLLSIRRSRALQWRITSGFDDIFNQLDELQMQVAEQLYNNQAPPNFLIPFFPGLTAQRFYKPHDFLLWQSIEPLVEKIRSEILVYSGEMISVGEYTAERDAGLVLQGSWRDVGIIRGGVPFDDVAGVLSVTLNTLMNIPEVATNVYGNAVVSTLEPGTRIKLHQGESNAQITFHIPIDVPLIGTGITVDGIHRDNPWVQTLVFDDSFKHEVWNLSQESRTILLFRAWHPEFSIEERIMVVKNNPFNLSKNEQKRLRKILAMKETRKRWKRELQHFRERQGKKMLRDELR